jgi:lipopolysaccharide export system permease protein
MWDLLKVFAITLVSLTGLFLLGGLVAEASQRGLAPAQMLTIIPLMIPSLLPYTIPAATLFTTCNVYGRLAKDNEVTALRAAGVNLFTILKPSLVLGVLASGATLGLYYQIIPRSFQMVREHLLGDTNELLMTMLKRNGCIRDRRLPYVLFAREVRGDRLVDAIFKRRVAKAPPDSPIQYDTVARAREAHLRVETIIDPKTGKEVNEVVVVMSNCVLCNEPKKGASPATLTVRHQEYRERLPAEVFGDKDSPRSCDVEWPELLRRTAMLRERERLRGEDLLRDEGRLPRMSKAEKDGLDSKRWVQKFAQREWRSYEAEIQTRPALALGCICFVLAGAPIGIWASRADFLSSFVIGFLPAVTLYYPMLICGTNIGKDGKVPMIPAVWAADAVFLVAALYMCVRVVRR